MIRLMIISLLSLTFFINCKSDISLNKKNDYELDLSVKLDDTIIEQKKQKQILKGICDLDKFLMNIGQVNNTSNKHSDWMTNKIGFLDKLIELNEDSLFVKSTSYEYKNKFIFYTHTLKHKDENRSLKTYIENANDRHTEGYTKERVLMFCMKNNKEANFVDVPPNWGYSKLRKELIAEIYSKLNVVVLSCDTTKACVIKDLRK